MRMHLAHKLDLAMLFSCGVSHAPWATPLSLLSFPSRQAPRPASTPRGGALYRWGEAPRRQHGDRVDVQQRGAFFGCGASRASTPGKNDAAVVLSAGG